MRFLDFIALPVSVNGFFQKRESLMRAGYKRIGAGEGSLILGLADEMYLDTEMGKLVSVQDLMSEYAQHRYEIEESSGAKSFSEWLSNAVAKNGFLERVE